MSLVQVTVPRAYLTVEPTSWKISAPGQPVIHLPYRNILSTSATTEHYMFIMTEEAAAAYGLEGDPVPDEVPE